MKRKKQTCPECGGDYIKFQSFQKCCTKFSCMQSVANKKKKKVYKKETTRLKKEHRKTDLQWQLNRTQIVFNKLRKLQEYKWFADRGLEPECISCGKKNMDWCCGHFKSVGAQGILRFDTSNTFLQCNRYCNMGLSGNIEGTKTTRGYRQGLIERFGENTGNQLIKYCESKTQTADWNVSYLIEDRKLMNIEIRKLEKN